MRIRILRQLRVNLYGLVIFSIFTEQNYQTLNFSSHPFTSRI